MYVSLRVNFRVYVCVSKDVKCVCVYYLHMYRQDKHRSVRCERIGVVKSVCVVRYSDVN